MGYKLNIRGVGSWVNLLEDSNIEVVDLNGYFTSTTLDGVLDELHNASISQTLDEVTTNGNTTSNDIVVHGVDTDFITFNLNPSGAPNTQGTMRYNIEDDTVEIIHENGVIQQVGQEFFVPPTKNTSGVVINNGDFVMVTGVQGDKMTIAKAVTDGTINSHYMIGVATHDITIDSEVGRVTTNGIVRGINLDGFTEGDVLYPDPTTPGGWVNTPPVAPSIRRGIAIVIRESTPGQPNGWIYVRFIVSEKFGAENDNVDLTGLTTDDLLIYNDTTGIWGTINKSELGGGGASLTWSTVSTSGAIEKDNGYFVDATAGIITLTLPVSASIGDNFSITDSKGIFGTNICTVARNGHLIMGLDEDFDCNYNNFSANFTYAGATDGWRVTYAVEGRGGSGGGGLIWNVVTTDTIAETNNAYVTNTVSASGDITVTLPSTPTAGDQVGILEIGSTYSCIVSGGGEPIQGVSEPLTLDSDNQSCLLVYVDSTFGWRLAWTSPAGTGSSVPETVTVQPLTTDYTTGGIIGGELEYVGVDSFNVGSVSCLDDTLQASLIIDSTTLVTLVTPTINTIYNVFLVKYTSGAFGVVYDTDVDGANLSVLITHKRWLGFVRTNASGDISMFQMSGDLVHHNIPSEWIVTTNITGSVTLVDVSSFVPVERISEIQMGGRSSSTGSALVTVNDSNGNIFNHFNLATNVQTTIWNGTTGSGPRMVPFTGSLYMVGNATHQLSPLLNAVKLKR